MKVKICGITCLADARVSLAAGADFLGINFYPRSPRYLAPEGAVTLVAALPSTVQVVGVFVNAPREEVERIARQVGISLLQFHGDEPPDYCEGWEWPVIKALRTDSANLLAAAAAYKTDYLLVDSAASSATGGERAYGGTGRPLDLHALAGLPRERLFVAGGLTPENVAEIVRRVRPFAVDVATGVEWAPGRKDPSRIFSFVSHAKGA